MTRYYDIARTVRLVFELYHLRSLLVPRHCTRLPRRCTLINMFGIVWSLVEILSRAAGSRPLLDVSRSPPCEHAMWRDCAAILRRGKPFVLAYLAVSSLTRLDPEINESQAPLARTVLTVKRSRGLLRCDLPFPSLSWFVEISRRANAVESLWRSALSARVLYSGLLNR